MATLELNLSGKHLTFDGVPSVFVPRRAEALPALRTYGDTRVIEALNHLGMVTNHNFALFLPEASADQMTELVRGAELAKYASMGNCIEKRQTFLFGDWSDPRQIQITETLRNSEVNPKLGEYRDYLCEALMEYTPAIETANLLAIIGSFNYRVAFANAESLKAQGDTRRAKALDIVLSVMDERKSLPVGYDEQGNFLTLTGLRHQPDIYAQGPVYQLIQKAVDRFKT